MPAGRHRRVPAVRSAARWRPGRTGTLLAACTALAAASLALPAVIGYDPWAWLVWGREVTRGQLSTDGGPAWKPLPVLVTTVLAVFGDAAPEFWLLLARAGGLFAMVLTYRLAARFAGPVAGGVALLALLLTPDGESRWIRHLLQGNVEPLTVGLCLWAVQRHLDHRRGHAVLLGATAGLLRPEVWPFLALYAGWLLWREPSQWRVIVPVLPAVPLLWFGGDWWVSGDPWSGADRAQVLDGTTAQQLALAMGQVGNAVILPVWVAAAVCVAWAARRREPAPVVLAAGALAWMIVVTAMAGVFGYAALSRFLAPAAAVLCVLAGIAAARAVTAVDGIGLRLAAAAVLVVATVPFAAPRVQWLSMQLAAAADRAWLEEDLDRAITLAGGRDALLACGALAIDGTESVIQIQPALAWKLDVPLARVQYSSAGLPGMAIARNGSAMDVMLSAAPAPDSRVMARTPGWTVYALGCPASFTQ